MMILHVSVAQDASSPVTKLETVHGGCPDIGDAQMQCAGCRRGLALRGRERAAVASVLSKIGFRYRRRPTLVGCVDFDADPLISAS